MLLFTNPGETTMSTPSAIEILEAAGIDPQEAALNPTLVQKASKAIGLAKQEPFRLAAD